MFKIIAASAIVISAEARVGDGHTTGEKMKKTMNEKMDGAHGKMKAAVSTKTDSKDVHDKMDGMHDKMKNKVNDQIDHHMGKKHHGHHGKHCVTEDEITLMMDTWLGALQQIGQAFTTGNATQPFDPTSNAINKMDCEAATAHAKAVLETAYAYSNNVSVLFKPTYASGEETFRPTQDGALAYFVGKTCMDKVYPDKDWSEFAKDGGFALGNTAGEAGDMATYMGFEKGTYAMPHYLVKHNHKHGANKNFCHTGLVQAQLTIPPIRQRVVSKLGDSVVDKSFAFIRNPDYKKGDGSLPLKFVLHHSSVITPEPIVMSADVKKIVAKAGTTTTFDGKGVHVEEHPDRVKMPVLGGVSNLEFCEDTTCSCLHPHLNECEQCCLVKNTSRHPFENAVCTCINMYH